MLGNYTHPRYGYVIGDEAVGDDWRLENFAVDAEGRPTTALEGPRYAYRLAADMDGDGEIETVADQPYWDVRFRHRRDAGELWVSTLPLSSELGETQLRVLARRYVEAVSGTGIALVQLGSELGLVQRRYATRVIAERSVVIDDFDAFEVVFEVANVEQLQLDASARWQRARVVLVRPGLYWRPASYGLQVLPVVMTIGYVNHPSDFASNEGAFDRLVGRILIEDPSLVERSDAILSCFPGAPNVSFLATRQTLWSYREIDASGVARETSPCLAEALRGFVPANLARAKHYVRAVARPRAVPSTAMTPSATMPPATMPPATTPAATTPSSTSPADYQDPPGISDQRE